MTDRESRNRLASVLRRLASGLMTNDDFTDEVFSEFCHRRDDPALAELATCGRLHYGDFPKHRLRAHHRLSREERRSIARAVLFLKTDQKYAHGASLASGTIRGRPLFLWYLVICDSAILAGVLACYMLNMFLIGCAAVMLLARCGHRLVVAVQARMFNRRWRNTPRINDAFWPYIDEHACMEQFRFWPFASRAAYEAALTDPPFLGGRRRDR